DPRQKILAGRGRGRTHDGRALLLGHFGDQRRIRLGRVVLEPGVIEQEQLGDVLGRFSRVDAAAGQHAVHLAAVLLGRFTRECDRRQARGAQLAVLSFEINHDVAHQITFASLWSLLISSGTSLTLTPALRAGGASMLTYFTRGVASTPRLASATSFNSF